MPAHFKQLTCFFVITQLYLLTFSPLKVPLTPSTVFPFFCVIPSVDVVYSNLVFKLWQNTRDVQGTWPTLFEHTESRWLPLTTSSRELLIIHPCWSDCTLCTCASAYSVLLSLIMTDATYVIVKAPCCRHLTSLTLLNVIAYYLENSFI